MPVCSNRLDSVFVHTAKMLVGMRKIRAVTALLSITSVTLFISHLWIVFVCSYGSNVCSCPKCLTDGDPFFTELISSSPKPFLSGKSAVSEKDFIWWKRIYSESYNFSFYNATVKSLFETIPPVPDVVEGSPERCRTCAVVGNSANLKRSHYGPLIDYHDIVIRMNHGHTKGYEADVGNRTTHHVMYPESAAPLDSTTHLVLFPFKIKDLQWLLQKFSQGKKNGANSNPNKDLVMVLSPAFMKYVHENWLDRKGRYPSTGFLTVALSMYICDEISVFGFGADSDGNWGHYFEVLRNKNLRTGPHAGTHEYEVIEELHKTEKINFYKGW